MRYSFSILPNERQYLRELGKKYVEYANLPVMEERSKLWYAHNSLKSERPLIVMEQLTFEHDILPPLQCVTEVAREIERNLVDPIVNFDLINDDKVISPYYSVYYKIELKEFGLDIKKDYAEDSSGRKIGFTTHHPVTDLKEALPLLKHSIYSVDREYTLARKEFVEEILGDILPVKLKNDSLTWYVAPSEKVIRLMGLETMMYSLVDYPDEMHDLYNYLKEDMLGYIKWQETEGLLTLNNGNDYAGAGSYGFTRELSGEKYNKSGIVTTSDLWVNMNSQETVGISPEMFGEFIFPYYYDLAKEFGLVYYGCCEPVHSIWEDYISKLPGLRKVSVSPWCDEDYMGEVLKGSNVIYSRKPSPNYIGVGDLDEAAFKEHMAKTLNSAKGCHLEIIFRDVYTLNGDRNKPGKAVNITRELIDKQW